MAESQNQVMRFEMNNNFKIFIIYILACRHTGDKFTGKNPIFRKGTASTYLTI